MRLPIRRTPGTIDSQTKNLSVPTPRVYIQRPTGHRDIWPLSRLDRISDLKLDSHVHSESDWPPRTFATRSTGHHYNWAAWLTNQFISPCKDGDMNMPSRMDTEQKQMVLVDLLCYFIDKSNNAVLKRLLMVKDK